MHFACGSELGLHQRVGSHRISPNKPSGHQSRAQAARPKDVCFESGVLAKPVISPKPRGSWATELSEGAGFFLSVSQVAAWVEQDNLKISLNLLIQSEQIIQTLPEGLVFNFWLNISLKSFKYRVLTKRFEWRPLLPFCNF